MSRKKKNQERLWYIHTAEGVYTVRAATAPLAATALYLATGLTPYKVEKKRN